MGLGAFEAVSQQPYPQVAGYVPDPDMSHVHNILLQLGVDFGLPGMIVFVTLLATLAVLTVQLIGRTPISTPLYTWSVGLLGTLIAYLVYNSFDALTLGARPAVVVWLFFGLCIGAGEWSRRTRIEHEGVSSVAVNSPPAPAPLVVSPEFVLSATPSTSNDDAWDDRAWAITTGSQKS